MIRIKEIQEKLFHLIGWKQNYDTTDLRISNELTRSESGMYYQQIHPLLTLDNLADIAPDFTNMKYPDYDPSVPYKKGNIVKFGGSFYKALQPVQGQQPSDDQINWTETNPFSEWLEDKTKASIQRAILSYCNEKASNGSFRELCEHKTLFDGTGRISDLIKNEKNLVGFEIVPIRSKGVTTTINKIGLQFTEPGKYTLFLMHSSMDAPVRVLELEKLRKNSIEWFTFDDLVLPYQSDSNDAGGSWYLCYFQSSLPSGSHAIKKNRDWSKGPCESCSRHEYAAWMSWSRYLEVHPFYVNEEQVDGVSFNDDYNDDFDKQKIALWDIQNNVYTYDTNYGINLELSVECDITNFIVEQRSLFQTVISLQLAIDMLREFAFNANARTNRHSINASRMDILYELDGDSSSMKRSGLCYQLETAMKALKLSTQGMDRVCLPCKNNGIRYRVV